MQFSQTPIPGAWLIDIDPVADERGMFARTGCREEFKQHNLNSDFCQQNVSWNVHAGTLRGMHAQAFPYEEEKLVRVTRGAVFDVIVDIRPESPTFRQWFGVELSADNRRQLYIPKGVAHGFQTLCDATEMFYQMTTPYQAEASIGIRWDDPSIGIAWPDHPQRIISPKDRALPFLAELP